VERAWDAGSTHGGILRAMGPWAGEKMMKRYAAGRFSSSSSSGPPPAVPSSDAASGGDNNGNHNNGNGNGNGNGASNITHAAEERKAALSPEEADVVGGYLWALTSLEGSGEHALRHLLGFGAFAHAPLGKRLEALTVPVTCVYGEKDWMDYRHAKAVAERLDALRKPVAAEDHAVIVLPNSGHFPFLEHPGAFDEALARILRQYGGGGGGVGQGADGKEGAAAAR
jgi:pimeloyl-ACP methyl ester carboxylesterase